MAGSSSNSISFAIEDEIFLPEEGRPMKNLASTYSSLNTIELLSRMHWLGSQIVISPEFPVPLLPFEYFWQLLKKVRVRKSFNAVFRTRGFIISSKTPASDFLTRAL